MENEDRLLRKLREDVESEDAARNLLSTLRKLEAMASPLPDREQTLRLLERLELEMPARAPHQTLALLHSQIRIVRRDLWLASLLLMALGLVLTVSQSNTLLFGMIAPFVAAAGIAFLYDSTDANVQDLENSTPTPAAVLLFARLLLVFGFDLLLALGSSVILTVMLPGVSLLPLIVMWFAPMAFLSACAFFLSVTLADTLAAMLFSLTLWVLHLFLRTERNFWLWTLSLPGLTSPEMSPLLLLAAAGLVFSAFIALGAAENGELAQ